MGKWALLSTIIALTGILSLIVTPGSSAFSNPFDTQKRIGEFGENVQIFLTSHSGTVFDRAIVNAEHKIMRLQDKANNLQQDADEAKAEADAEPPGKKKDRLNARADRIQGKADKAADTLCVQALNEQTKLAADGKNSTFIDGVVSGCP